MKTLLTQKRIAAHVMNVGLNKVWFDPMRLNEIKEAITKSDIDALIKDGAIKKRVKGGIKRRAGRIREQRKRKGRGRGHGRKKLIVKQKKHDYMIRIRNLRSHLKSLRKQGAISSMQENKLRRLAKAGEIRNKRDVSERTK